MSRADRSSSAPMEAHLARCSSDQSRGRAAEQCRGGAQLLPQPSQGTCCRPGASLSAAPRRSFKASSSAGFQARRDSLSFNEAHAEGAAWPSRSRRGACRPGASPWFESPGAAATLPCARRLRARCRAPRFGQLRLGSCHLERKRCCCATACGFRGACWQAQLCWSMGKLQEAPAPLCEALFAAAAQRYGEFAPQGWANIAWACARLCPRGPRSALNCTAKMIAAAAGALRSRPTAFAVQNMSNLAWAAGTLVIRDSPFFSSLASACRFAELGAQHVANIAWSFGTVAHRNDQFIQLLSQRAVDIGLATFQPEEFAGFLYALGMLSSAPPMLDAALREVQRRVTGQPGQPGQLGATELSGVIWALAALGQDSEAFAAAARAAEDRAAELSPQGVANVFWAFATLEVPGELGTSFPRLSGAARACSPELMPQGLVNLAWALTVLMAAEAGSGSLEASTLQSTLSLASNLVGSLKTLELAALSWVVAHCRADHVSAQARNLEAPLATEVLQRLAGAEAFEARQLSNLAWAFATMASRATVVEALGRAALPRLEGFSSQGLSNMAWALGCTTVFAAGIGERLLRGLAAASVSRSFSPQGVALLAWAFAPESRMRMDPIPSSPAAAKLHLLETIQREVQVGLRQGSHPRTASDG
ncbi:unnamed protein product [Symbiodinium sp. CCMP2456]|nr:unnamed protein product [Symbiodinium sp. CCMP2456]